MVNLHSMCHLLFLLCILKNVRHVSLHPVDVRFSSYGGLVEGNDGADVTGGVDELLPVSSAASKSKDSSPPLRLRDNVNGSSTVLQTGEADDSTARSINASNNRSVQNNSPAKSNDIFSVLAKISKNDVPETSMDHQLAIPTANNQVTSTEKAKEQSGLSWLWGFFGSLADTETTAQPTTAAPKNGVGVQDYIWEGSQRDASWEEHLDSYKHKDDEDGVFVYDHNFFDYNSEEDEDDFDLFADYNDILEGDDYEIDRKTDQSPEDRNHGREEKSLSATNGYNDVVINSSREDSHENSDKIVSSHETSAVIEEGHKTYYGVESNHSNLPGDKGNPHSDVNNNAVDTNETKTETSDVTEETRVTTKQRLETPAVNNMSFTELGAGLDSQEQTPERAEKDEEVYNSGLNEMGVLAGTHSETNYVSGSLPVEQSGLGSGDGGSGSAKEWSEWSECSATCGHGFRDRHRDCGDSCVYKETVECKVKSCHGIGLLDIFPQTNSQDFTDGPVDMGIDTCDQWATCKDEFFLSQLKNLKNLPSCPCYYPVGLKFDNQVWDPETNTYTSWEDASGQEERLDVYKPDAKHCIRSSLVPNSGVFSVQHCCYDGWMQLITRGQGAGTPNLVSSELSYALHYKIDILPWINCKGDWRRYNKVIPPNNQQQCTQNPDEFDFLQQIKEREVNT